MEGQTTADVIATWLPLVIIFGAFAFFMRSSMRQYYKHVDEVNAVNQQIVDTNREMLAELKAIKEELRKPS
ncbi:MAG: hypothetical protein AAFP99_12175 [Pseudomonadota bacterium]